jgi:hypothetical protein
VTVCVWVRRDGLRCSSVAVVGELCAGHCRMQAAVDREEEERTGRGLGPMSGRERELFLRRLRRLRKAEKNGSHM